MTPPVYDGDCLVGYRPMIEWDENSDVFWALLMLDILELADRYGYTPHGTLTGQQGHGVRWGEDDVGRWKLALTPTEPVDLGQDWELTPAGPNTFAVEGWDGAEPLPAKAMRLAGDLAAKAREIAELEAAELARAGPRLNRAQRRRRAQGKRPITERRLDGKLATNSLRDLPARVMGKGVWHS